MEIAVYPVAESSKILGVEFPHTQVYDYTGEPVGGPHVVEFRLLYGGKLLGASRNDTRAAMKHEIRRLFHPQLRQLWSLNPNLREMLRQLSPQWLNQHQETVPDSEPFREWKPSEREEFGRRYLGEQWERYGYRCIPLITEEVCLRCSLEILFLRPEAPGGAVHG